MNRYLRTAGRRFESCSLLSGRDSSVGRAAEAERHIGSKNLFTPLLENEMSTTIESLEKSFKKMGANARISTVSRRTWPQQAAGDWLPDDPLITLDVRRGKEGEYFDLRINPIIAGEVQVLEVQPKDRHLVLMAKQQVGNNRFEKSKFLCGHDERHWFVAAIPESASVTTVQQAKEALKPDSVLQKEIQTQVPTKEKFLHRNDAWKRQGEWFFVPADINVPAWLVLKNEPFNRGRGKFHYAEEAFRTGGRTVWVGRKNQILSDEEFQAKRSAWQGASRKDRDASMGGGWAAMKADADMYVRGRITHTDHATLILEGWHKVVMNMESQARAMGNVVFLD